jgi:hypothetical protein
MSFKHEVDPCNVTTTQSGAGLTTQMPRGRCEQRSGFALPNLNIMDISIFPARQTNLTQEQIRDTHKEGVNLCYSPIVIAAVRDIPFAERKFGIPHRRRPPAAQRTGVAIARRDTSSWTSPSDGSSRGLL